MVRRLLIAIVLIYMGILILAPLAAIVQGAFSRGLAPVIDTLRDADVIHAFWITLVLCATALLVNTVFGIITAWVLVRDRFPGRRFINGLVDLPLVVSPVIAGYMIILLFGRQGWFAPLLNTLNFKVVFALPGMLMATIFVSLPFVIREVMPVLEAVGTEQESAAHTLGATGWQTFWRVTLPSIRWGVAYGVMLSLARTLGEFGAVLVVSGAVSGLTETATIYIFRALDERQYVSAYTVSLILAGVSFIMLLGMEWFRGRTEHGR
ncbi:MAG: molybdate ABC transporter permease subunit [Anaerolineae bacterium]